MWSAATVLACALAVLGRSEHRFHPINLIEVAPLGVSRNAEAFVTRNPPTIHLLTSSEAFRDAVRAQSRCGDRAALAKLASILVHEQWHLENGPDERGAYAQQLTTLTSLGFDENTRVYYWVKRAMLERLRVPRRLVRLPD